MQDGPTQGLNPNDPGANPGAVDPTTGALQSTMQGNSPFNAMSLPSSSSQSYQAPGINPGTAGPNGFQQFLKTIGQGAKGMQQHGVGTPNAGWNPQSPGGQNQQNTGNIDMAKFTRGMIKVLGLTPKPQAGNMTQGPVQPNVNTFNGTDDAGNTPG